MKAPKQKILKSKQPPTPNESILGKLKTSSSEQTSVVGPLIQFLVTCGWQPDQIIFGKKEWRVPKSPSEAHQREKGRHFEGFPCDITLFDSPKRTGDPKHAIAIIECKQPNESKGVSQLEQLLSNEPHVKFGAWCNSADPTAECLFVYREASGNLIRRRKIINQLPRPGEKITPDSPRLTFKDMTPPSEETLQRVFSHLLDRVVANDANVTRREDQLDELCNLLLLKLESDKRSKAKGSNEPPIFRPMETAARTGEEIRNHFASFVDVYPEVFTEKRDKEIHFSDETIYLITEEISNYRLIDISIQSVALAFQVLRSAALKQKEGQYFTPLPVIETGVRLLQLKWDDIIIDPACGTGNFLVQAILEMGKQITDKAELTRWAQTHVYGIDKDKIGIKLTKAIMQIAGDGSAHCARGDSLRTHQWTTHYPYLKSGFENGRFSVVVTNPPFGTNLKASAEDSRLSGLDIAKAGTAEYQEMEIGILFLQRAYELLKVGGRLGIILPETYFFSSNYSFIFEWLRPRLQPIAVTNVPMDAFQGFCRAKTNFYIFKKIEKEENGNVFFLNPSTCGIYKNGKTRYKVDPKTGKRTAAIDNELSDISNLFLEKKKDLSIVQTPIHNALEKRILVPRYYDKRWNLAFDTFVTKNELGTITLEELIKQKILHVREGHGSPSNDKRTGAIPYVKVSDIRSLRINVNPTNLVTQTIAEIFWKGPKSGLSAWSVLTPNRASSNIGEFAMLLPGEEEIVLTKEVFVFSINEKDGWDPFYLFWALCLKSVRHQWQRITLMQTNREDCGKRWNEITLPIPKSPEWAKQVSKGFREYFTTIGTAKKKFVEAAKKTHFEYIASVTSLDDKTTEQPKPDGSNA
jgi:type I restriction enzyme M protein